jgi:putative serine protease PepD
MRRFIPLIVVALASAAAAVAAFALISPGGTTKTVVRQSPVSSAQPAAETSNLSVTDVYNRAEKGVVEITVKSTVSGNGFPFGGGSQTQQAQGSGFVYDAAGHVVTNQHVVDGAQSISVRFWNGAAYQAKVVGADPSTDIAVIKVDAPASMLHPLALGDSGSLQVGQGVVAIGSPFGLEETVTAGIISALHREMTAPNNFTIADSIQTDAAINHGNSGGPLLDMAGQVVGINSAGDDNAQNIGFAIAIDSVKSAIEQAINNPAAAAAYLGVSSETVTPAMAGQLGLAVDSGAYVVATTDGGPAAQAGVKDGDIIVAIDGKTVSSADDVGTILAGLQPGQSVSLDLAGSNGGTRSVDVTLGTRPLPTQLP